MPNVPRLRPAVLAARERLETGRQKLKEQHDRGSPGIQVCARLADLLDEVVLSLFESALAASGHEGLESEIALVPNGGYEVTLYFCEYWSTEPSRRRFSIAAERRPAIVNIDLLRASGGFAIPFSYPIRNVVVNDGRLDVEFKPSTSAASAILNGISIKQVR